MESGTCTKLRGAGSKGVSPYDVKLGEEPFLLETSLVAIMQGLRRDYLIDSLLN